jgi:hypothetical protein
VIPGTALHGLVALMGLFSFTLIMLGALVIV